MLQKWWVWLWLIGTGNLVLGANADDYGIESVSTDSEEEEEKVQLSEAAKILEKFDDTEDYEIVTAEPQTQYASSAQTNSCKIQPPSGYKRCSDCVWNALTWCAGYGREAAYSTAYWSVETIQAFQTYWNFLKEHNQLPQLSKDLQVVFARDIMQIIAAQAAFYTAEGLSLKWDEINESLQGIQRDTFYTSTIFSYVLIINGIIRLYMHIIPMTMKHVGAIGTALGNSASPCKSTCSQKAYLQGYAGSITTMALLATLPLLQHGIVPEIRPLLSVWISFQLISACIESGSPDDCWAHINKRIEGNAVKITATALVFSQLPAPIQIISTLFLAGSTRLGTSFSHPKGPVSAVNRIFYQLAGLPRIAIQGLLDPATKAVIANIFDTDPTLLPKRIVRKFKTLLRYHEYLSTEDKCWYTQLVVWSLIPPELLDSNAFARDSILSEALLSILPAQKPEKIETYIRFLLTLREYFLGQIALDVMSNPGMQEKGGIVTKQPAWLINWAQLLLTDTTCIEDIKNILDRREGLENLIAMIEEHQGNLNPTLDASGNTALKSALEEELTTIIDEHQGILNPTLTIQQEEVLREALAEIQAGLMIAIYVQTYQRKPNPTLGLAKLSALQAALAEETKKNQ